MRLSKVLLTFAATSMVAMPVAANAAVAQPAAKLSLSKSVPASVRVASKAGKSKAVEGGVIVLIAAAAAVIAGVVIATDGSPDSD